MNTDEILIDYIKKNLLKSRVAILNKEDDLFSSGILNSLGMPQLVTFIEERFGIQVPDEDVMYENFHTVEAISTYVTQHR